MLDPVRVAVIGIILAATLLSVSPGSSPSNIRNRMSTLNVASRIYVINLPKSTRRRFDMERLRYALGLDFTYVDGTEADGDTPYKIMAQVAAFRSLAISQQTDNSRPLMFDWPEDVDTLVESNSPLEMKGSDLWLSSDTEIPAPSHEPLPCIYDNSISEKYSPQMPPWRLLTKERVACWHSHWRVIRSIADSQDDVSLILEDDVDMELDIRQRLLGVWDSLPVAWDIVFLGHCWSDESSKPSIPTFNSSIRNTKASVTFIHPSTSPKCTHAYAVSRTGARRLAAYLRHPPFSYSRPIDRAFAWLVESGKLRSYSIVPSVVAQRKVDASNIPSGKGSTWKENLTRGVFS